MDPSEHSQRPELYLRPVWLAIHVIRGRQLPPCLFLGPSSVTIRPGDRGSSGVLLEMALISAHMTIFAHSVLPLPGNLMHIYVPIMQIP